MSEAQVKKRSNKRQRTSMVFARVLPSEFERVLVAAVARGETVSQFVRRTALEAADHYGWGGS